MSTAAVQCPRCHAPTIPQPGLLSRCLNCETKFTNPAPEPECPPRCIALTAFLRHELLQGRQITPDTAFTVDHTQEMHATATGAALYIKDTWGNRYTLTVEAH